MPPTDAVKTASFLELAFDFFKCFQIMAGIKGRSGGARAGAGRKPKPQMEELRSLLDEAWPREARINAIRALACFSDAGFPGAMRLLLAYAYGTPTTLDESAIAQAVSVEIDAFMDALKDRLDARTFAKVVAAVQEIESGA